MSDRTIGILGLGIFGSSVLTALAKHDINIIAIDNESINLNQSWCVVLLEISQMRNSCYQLELIPAIP